MRLPEAKSDKVEIDDHIRVAFSYVVGKDVEKAVHDARLVALSRKELFLDCSEEVRTLSNIRLQLLTGDEVEEATREVYGKLLGTERDGRARLRVTSMSPSAESALSQLLVGT